MNEPPKYKALQFIVERGVYLPVITAIGVLVMTVLLWSAGSSVIVVPIGIALAVFMYLLMRSYVELVQVIVDMLLPK